MFIPLPPKGVPLVIKIYIYIYIKRKHELETREAKGYEQVASKSFETLASSHSHKTVLDPSWIPLPPLRRGLILIALSGYVVVACHCISY